MVLYQKKEKGNRRLSWKFSARRFIQIKKGKEESKTMDNNKVVEKVQESTETTLSEEM